MNVDKYESLNILDLERREFNVYLCSFSKSPMCASACISNLKIMILLILNYLRIILQLS